MAVLLSAALTLEHECIFAIKTQLNLVLRPAFQEVIPHAALHFQWQAVSLILRAIRTINADRINTCVLAPAPPLEIACHCWQTNIRAGALWRRGNRSAIPLRSSNTVSIRPALIIHQSWINGSEANAPLFTIGRCNKKRKKKGGDISFIASNSGLGT